jgi:anthranilate synthase component II
MSEIIVVDNHDSFTFNLVESFVRFGHHVKTVRNTASASAVFDEAQGKGALIVLSPGPGRPENAGCTVELLSLARGRVPVLGICLGHQAMVLEAGGEVGSAPTLMHGKSSLIPHDGEGPFAGLPNPFRAGRYHSLCTIDPPRRFHVHAEIDGMAMAISDVEARQFGLQFHPESILTPHGDALLQAIYGQLTGR